MIVGDKTLQITLTTEILGNISQINTQSISIYKYFVQLRYHQENTDLYGLE